VVDPVCIYVSGIPVGKARARVTRYGTYTPAKTADYETLIALSGKVAMRGRELMTGPVQMTLWMYVRIPASWSKKKQHMACCGQILPTTKPDSKNILSSVEDALNGVVYNDDRQIVVHHLYRFYSADPRIEVEIADLPLSPCQGELVSSLVALIESRRDGLMQITKK
jgi:Holliday junction resolvase RusA-like endonuclease